jgi:GGDEF domain-containing protein
VGSVGYIRRLVHQGSVKRSPADLGHWRHVLSDVLDAVVWEDAVTGLPGRAAYDSTPRRPAQLWADVRDLHGINQRFGTACGDEVLWRVARALQRRSPHVYHFFADKFIVEADSLEDAARIAAACRRELAWQWVEVTMPDGGRRTLRGVFLWWGIGRTLHKAEQAAMAVKRRG